MRTGLMVLAMLVSAAVNGPAMANTFIDPLDVAAPVNSSVDRSQLLGVASAGNRLVTVGVRGGIALSDDQGKTWRQVSSPVSSDLVAVQFPTALQGWAVGHDGVVLHTQDAGEHWNKQFDGNQARDLAFEYFKQRVAVGDGQSEQMLADMELNYANGPEQALLDVWFEDEHTGYVVGSFGSLFVTQDGGKTWTCWIDRTDAPTLLHFNSIRRVGKDLYIGSEQGLVFKFDPAQQRFIGKNTGYEGSFFALAGDDQRVVAFGLLGNAYASIDKGHTWAPLKTATNGSFTSAMTMPNGRIYAATRNGQVVVSDGPGSAFAPMDVAQPMLVTAIAAVRQTVALVGLSGVRTLALK